MKEKQHKAQRSIIGLVRCLGLVHVREPLHRFLRGQRQPNVRPLEMRHRFGDIHVDFHGPVPVAARQDAISESEFGAVISRIELVRFLVLAHCIFREGNDVQLRAHVTLVLVILEVGDPTQ
ncbi:hypothetical protein AMAG_18459 [Allomyces macrogynus ATCC 38327]|uniref:Uncharacterized protein n=1 Tax=Allomyces macrogynus (strain ATCC 38327) TaxID=578462 RepID=A0A0L0SC96_ALLM3|nr:hypothetical protein AMAG_18459 [Allomyces macrogynus ATCC 38327]|eukprot:KNE60039.1 hypothetical protein AMAG_18459 [Allomyces macrogynus ATCC 38327]